MNALQVQADADTIRAVSDSAAIGRIELNAGDLNETVNMGENIRVATQIKQYLDNGFDGSTSSGRSAIDTIYVALVDNKVVIDHPAWDDCLTCASRLVRQEEWTGSAWIEDTVGNTGGEQHGMWVAGQLLADLTQGQDPLIRTSTDRRARTGMTTETSFVAIDKGFTGGIDLDLDRGVELNVDIMNLSAGRTNCTACDLIHTRNDQVNVAYHQGVFFTKGAGNDGHATADCMVLPPGLAAGAFVVGGYDHTAADLNSGSIYIDSSRGGDALGRPVIDVTAAAGRSAGGLPEYDNTYSTTNRAGTSLAAPIAAGGAANLKHQLIDRWGAAIANQPGFLHAMLLLMGDGQLESGGMALPTTAVDELWGTGRLRMRLWTPEGLDAPYRFAFVKRVLSDGETASVPLYPDAYGVNQDIPSAVDWFKAVVWWYEPNVNQPSGSPAQLRTRVCDEDTGLCYTTATHAPDAHRLWLGDVVPDRPWS